MKNHYKLMAMLALAVSSVFAQNTRPCYTDEAMNDLFAKDPAAKARYEKSQHIDPSQRLTLNNATQSTYTVDSIPVVFHILNVGGPENVSDATVYQCLAEINLIHSKKNSDTTQIDPYFQPVAAANNYVFRLATKDPNGNCTNGIEHVYDVNTDWQQGNFGIYTHTWNPQKYLNVYIVRQIIPAGGGGGGGTIVGYTYLPGTWSTGAAEDVVIYNYQFMTGTNARSMAHEFGHWLGLSHTFGNTNSPGTCMSGGMSDDFLSSGAAGAGVIDDTPKTPGAFSTCPPSTPNSCDVSNYANVQNIMDYASCPKMFTAGQVHRMHNQMALTISGRNNVTTASNKLATGIRYPQICVPNADYKVTPHIACPNSTLTFADSSYNGRATSWNWSFPGGTLAGGSTVTDSMPKVNYAAPGTYAVSYTATNSAGSATKTKSVVFINTNVATYTTTFVESFESATLPGSVWKIGSSMGFDWAITGNAAATGTKCVWIDNFSNTAGNVSVLESTVFDVSGFVTPKMSFKLSYQQQASTNVDKLQVFSSIDCGMTWGQRWSRQGTTLANITPPSTNPFTPSSSQFASELVTLTAISGSTNARFRFVFTADPNGQGNNLYIDDINIYDASVGIKDIEAQVGLAVYPNPSSGKVNVDLDLSEAHNISVNVTDLIGRTVETIPVKNYGVGATSLTIAEKNYQSGIYFVNVSVDGKIISKKVVIQ